MSNDPREIALKKLVQLHSNSSNFNNPGVVEQAASLFLFLSDGYIRQPSGETFYSIPYRSITMFVFDNTCDFKSDEFVSFTSTVSEKIQNLPEFNSNPYRDHLIECYSKFTLHISLAQVQKEHVGKVAQNANIAAEAAQAAAEKAKKMQEDMMVNYITILGIFASIIITIFGGMQIISATTGLLQSDLNIATLILVLSFLTFLIILILWMLFAFISNLKSGGKRNYALIISLIILIITMGLSGGYMLHLKKHKLPGEKAQVLIKDDT